MHPADTSTFLKKVTFMAHKNGQEVKGDTELS